jgi:tRNA (mo5U34)-methyltransferase
VLSKGRRRRLVDQVGFWFHSIDVGHGVTTPGFKSAERLAAELETMELPADLTGRCVLDIGGWDGFFAFEAERRGAARVAVLDHYTWSLDLVGQQAYWRQCIEAGVHPEPYHETEYWQPDTLPGKAGFDTARSLRGSGVQEIAVDFMDCELAAVGSWDVALYLGVLYHMEDPLRALRRLAAVTGDVAIIETEAVVVPGHEDDALWRFFPGAELNGDASNWWAPNLTGLLGALSAAGFERVEVKAGPPAELLVADGDPQHYRAVVHALKPPRR